MMDCGSWNHMLVKMVWVLNGRKSWLSKEDKRDGWMKRLRMFFNVET